MKRFPKTLALILAAPLSLLAVGCDDDAEGDSEGEDTEHDSEDSHDSEDTEGDHDHNEETEVITTVEVTFTPDGGGTPVIATFDDPDGDGGMSGTATPVTLAADTTYTATVTFANGLEDPAEDITEEIREEAEEHQVFFDGGTLLTHAYADMESTYGDNAEGDDLPVGLSNTITAGAAGMGELVVQLQHLPDMDGTAVKVAGLEGMDLASLPGEPDASVTFDVTVE